MYSFIVPADDLTEERREAYIQKAARAAAQRALKTGAISSLDPDAHVVREADIVVDFGCGAGGWLTMPLLAVGTQYSVLASAVPAALTPALANNRTASFYSVSVETVPPPVNLLSFREGVAAGTTYAVFDLECLFARQTMFGFFTEPVHYDPQRVLNIVATCRIITNAQARVRLGCFIVEPSGPVIS